MHNIFVKSFLTRIGQSVLLEIFCARLTQRTRSFGRPVADGQGQSERNIRVAELICSQEDKSGSNRSPQDIEKLRGISGSSVRGFANCRRVGPASYQQLISKAVDQWRSRLKARSQRAH